MIEKWLVRYMLQLYARTDELIPQEFLRGYERGLITALAASIKKEGIKQALKVTPDGKIQYGNTRYWAARLAGLEHVPVDLTWFLGLKQFDAPTEQLTIFRKELFTEGNILPLHAKNPVTYRPVDIPLVWQDIPETEEWPKIDTWGSPELQLFRVPRVIMFKPVPAGRTDGDWPWTDRKLNAVTDPLPEVK